MNSIYSRGVFPDAMKTDEEGTRRGYAVDLYFIFISVSMQVVNIVNYISRVNFMAWLVLKLASYAPLLQ
jgi:hypothetical protein